MKFISNIYICLVHWTLCTYTSQDAKATGSSFRCIHSMVNDATCSNNLCHVLRLIFQFWNTEATSCSTKDSGFKVFLIWVWQILCYHLLLGTMCGFSITCVHVLHFRNHKGFHMRTSRGRWCSLVFPWRQRSLIWKHKSASVPRLCRQGSHVHLAAPMSNFQVYKTTVSLSTSLQPMDLLWAVTKAAQITNY